MPRLYVRIENPPVGHRDETTMERARRYARAGRVVFIAPLLIRFLDTAIQAAVVENVEAKLHAAITGGHYDRIDRRLSEKEMRALPLICPEKMLREGGSARNWSYSAAVKRSMRRDQTAEEVAVMRAAFA